MKLAFYKAKGNLMNALIRWWDAGIYSHCELVFSDGLSASATFRDGRMVRGKYIEYHPDNWDFVELPDSFEAKAREFYKDTEGMPYDLFGQLRFLFAYSKGNSKAFWCSEWVAQALGLREPWRYGPNGLYNVVCELKGEYSNGKP
jgi:hypothetical protein